MDWEGEGRAELPGGEVPEHGVSLPGQRVQADRLSFVICLEAEAESPEAATRVVAAGGLGPLAAGGAGARRPRAGAGARAGVGEGGGGRRIVRAAAGWLAPGAL